MIDKTGGSVVTNEVVFWNGFQWTTSLKEARIYSYEDAIKCKKLRAKKCDVDIHPWDRYGK
jgi:hypothetical protein